MTLSGRSSSPRLQVSKELRKNIAHWGGWNCPLPFSNYRLSLVLRRKWGIGEANLIWNLIKKQSNLSPLHWPYQWLCSSDTPQQSGKLAVRKCLLINHRWLLQMMAPNFISLCICREYIWMRVGGRELLASYYDGGGCVCVINSAMYGACCINKCLTLTLVALLGCIQEKRGKSLKCSLYLSPCALVSFSIMVLVQGKNGKCGTRLWLQKHCLQYPTF